MPTHFTIRLHGGAPGQSHLKSWLVETMSGGESWREMDHQEANTQTSSVWFTGTFAIAGGEECNFIQLVNISRIHAGCDRIVISGGRSLGASSSRQPSAPMLLSFSAHPGGRKSRSAVRSVGYTWAELPLLVCFRLGRTIGTNADSRVSSCRRRVQLSVFAWFLWCDRSISAATPTAS
jgi:hypothetical protein